MPIFTPTQGQGAFLPVKSPQVPAPAVDPLNVLGAAAVFQRNRQLNQYDEQLKMSARAIDLREKMADMENQQALFKMIGDMYSTGAAKNSNDKQNREFKINEAFYPKQVNERRNEYNNAVNEALGIVQGTKGKNSSNQVTADLIGSVQANYNKMGANASVREAIINSEKYDATVTAIDKLVNEKGMAPILSKQMELDAKMKANGEGTKTIFSTDFNPNSYVFDPNKYQENLEGTVKTLLNKHDVETIIKDGASISTQKKEQVQRSIDEVQAGAFEYLKNDHNVKGAMETLAYANETSPEEELANAINKELMATRNDLDRLVISETKQGAKAAEDLYKEPQMNETRSEIIRLGGDPDNPRENLGPAAAIRKIMKLRNDDASTPVTFDPETGDIVFGKLTRDEETGAVTGNTVRFPIINPIWKDFYQDHPYPDWEVTPDGANFMNIQTGETVPIPTDAASTTAPTTGPSNEVIPITEESLKEYGINISLKDGKDHKLSNRAIDVLKSVPTEFNIPDVWLTDSFRTEEENAALPNASPTSDHKKGDAIDIRTHNEKGTDFAKWVTQTTGGKKWLDENKYIALWENKGKSNEHLHLGPKGALDYVEDQESSSGKAAIVAPDGKQMTVSQLQFRGPNGNEFLKKIGIKGYDLNGILSDEDNKKLNNELASIGESELKQKAREHYAESILPAFQARVNEVWPNLDISAASESVKLPLISLSLQTGPEGQKKILNDVSANLGENPTEEKFVNELQAARKRYVDGSKSITEENKDKAGVRYETERKNALDLLGNSATPQAPAAPAARDTSTTPVKLSFRNGWMDKSYLDLPKVAQDTATSALDTTAKAASIPDTVATDTVAAAKLAVEAPKPRPVTEIPMTTERAQKIIDQFVKDNPAKESSSAKPAKEILSEVESPGNKDLITNLQKQKADLIERNIYKDNISADLNKIDSKIKDVAEFDARLKDIQKTVNESTTPDIAGDVTEAKRQSAINKINQDFEKRRTSAEEERTVTRRVNSVMDKFNTTDHVEIKAAEGNQMITIDKSNTDPPTYRVKFGNKVHGAYTEAELRDWLPTVQSRK